MNCYFPVFYNITGWNFCFIGGGNVAERRIGTLSAYPCRIYIIADSVTDKIKESIDQEKMIWIREKISSKRGKQLPYIFEKIRKKYKKYFQYRRNFSMVFACTDDRNVNRQIYEYCRRKKIPVNVADCKEESDFSFPGLLKQEDLVIAVTGNGNNHSRVREAMDQLREVFYGKKNG